MSYMKTLWLEVEREKPENQVLATEQEIRADVNADTESFHALGKPRYIDRLFLEARRRLYESVQIK